MKNNIDIDFVIKNKKWALNLKKVIKISIIKTMKNLKNNNISVTFLLCDDDEMKKLNMKWRKKNTPTNVLSFPNKDDIFSSFDEGEKKYIGDIAISYDTLEKEAVEQKKNIEHHLAHLSVHSILHLFGYDHINNSDADAMENKEIEILKLMNIENPYL